ncbi:MAG: hypothetical protein QM778_30475 [Myxococcales bacterium]
MTRCRTTRDCIRGLSACLSILLGACVQETFLLGKADHERDASEVPDARVDPDEEPDAGSGSESDAGEEPQATKPLVVSIEVRGRDHVIALGLGCGAECVDVRVHVAGGIPPYRVVWDDGEQGAHRDLCADPTRQRGGLVQDANTKARASASFSLGVVDYDACSSEGPFYRTCFAIAPASDRCANLEGTPATFDVGEPLPEGGRITAEFVVSDASSSAPYVSLYPTSETCVGSSVLSGTFENLSAAGDPARLLFDGYLDEDTRYLSLGDRALLPSNPPDVAAAAGGFSGEVLSAVVCEYTQYEPSDSAP